MKIGLSEIRLFLEKHIKISRNLARKYFRK